MTVTHVRVFYPADPLGIVPGGIDTFLRGLFKWAPPDLEFSLVGMTTEPKSRPQGRWTRCRIGQREFDFFPVVTVDDAGGRGRIPLSLRFSFGVQRYRSAVSGGFDVFDFHRPEPSLLFAADKRPKNAYFHNDPATIRSSQSDNLWRRLPGFYEGLERYTFEKFDSVWCVRESGVETLRQRYPEQASCINFIPTWVDADGFNEIDFQARQNLRHALADAHQIDLDSQWVISVGRLDTQKDPLLTLAAFARLRAEGRQIDWLVVGDGVLRAELEAAVTASGFQECVHFLGLRSPSEIADLLRAADAFALSSAYEGMPMALLEAFGCGLPAAVTDVGEVRRVLQPGINGAIATTRDEAGFALALSEVLDNATAWRGMPARAAVEAYQPAKVLVVAYENYRRLGQAHARIRGAAENVRADNALHRPGGLVIGLPIDALDPDSVRARINAWAMNHESRTVCFVNVHSAVHARSHEDHRLAILGADIAAPDGAPIAWTLRHKGYPEQRRVDGPGTMWQLCADAMAGGVKIGLYGSTPETLAALVRQLAVSFPRLDVAYVHSPPFRALTDDEEKVVCRDIAASGIGLLFVGLGCPKQELWMACHRGRVPAVMLGVGAAFEFHGGTASRAPAWLRDRGLEWLYRLVTQPRRLWRRYLFSNSVFLGLSALEALCGLPKRLPLVRRMPQTSFSDGQMMTMNATLDVRAIEELVTRIDARLSGPGGRVVGFVASGRGEGTTTLARGYASAVFSRLQRRVLVLGVEKVADLPGVLPSLATDQSLEACLHSFLGGGYYGSLGGGSSDETLWELLVRADLWAVLRSRFDCIVLDLPATSTSRIGLVCAAQCDGVVVVLEAEKTRAPVVENLINSLRSVGANTLGTVFNKRRYYLPQRIYRWL